MAGPKPARSATVHRERNQHKPQHQCANEQPGERCRELFAGPAQLRGPGRANKRKGVPRERIVHLRRGPMASLQEVDAELGSALGILSAVYAAKSRALLELRSRCKQSCDCWNREQPRRLGEKNALQRLCTEDWYCLPPDRANRSARRVRAKLFPVPGQRLRV